MLNMSPNFACEYRAGGLPVNSTVRLPPDAHYRLSCSRARHVARVAVIPDLRSLPLQYYTRAFNEHIQ